MAETGQVALPRHGSLLRRAEPRRHAPRDLSAISLVGPCRPAEQTSLGLEGFQPDLANQAPRRTWARLLGGDDTPALLFTASHGMGFPNGDPRQLPHQGGLLCQDWPGPEAGARPIPEDFYFSGDDVAADARLLGLISFHFACYGAGTPRWTIRPPGL